jgi:hypothetical protein
MGGDPHDPNDAEACLGNDVVKQLNDYFGDPKSPLYQTAQANNTFGGVGTDYIALIKAYVTAGLNVNGRWQAYLRTLASIDPQNISAIAGFRDSNLKSGAAMNTIIHLPEHGGHVRTKPRQGVDPAEINSPFPLP